MYEVHTRALTVLRLVSKISPGARSPLPVVEYVHRDSVRWRRRRVGEREEGLYFDPLP